MAASGLFPLVETARSMHNGRVGSLRAVKCFSLTPRLSGRTIVQLHGQKVQPNADYAYRGLKRRGLAYNSSLVRAVPSTRAQTGQPLTMAHVGAAIGDTVLCVLEHYPRDVGQFVRVKPGPEVHRDLVANLSGRADTVCPDAGPSDSPGEVADLLRTHSGTASAQGLGAHPATALDLTLAEEGPIDLIKAVTDGFDGGALADGWECLTRDRPTVVFEWQPRLAQATGQDWRRPFRTLHGAGYETFVWFEKKGTFSHLTRGYVEEEPERAARTCLEDRGPRPDWHYDVMAMHQHSPVPHEQVAELRQAHAARGRTGRRRR